MKKGFTLIELLIVMVVVTVLVTLGVPAYKTSMEKGRALEGMANAASVSEAVNAYYIRNGNSYGTANDLTLFALGNTAEGGAAGITASKFFNAPTIAVSGGTVTVSIKRSTNAYTIQFTNANGATTGRSCTGDTDAGRRYCKAIGF